MVCLRNKRVDTLHKGETKDNNNNNNNNNNAEKNLEFYLITKLFRKTTKTIHD
jgi:hypothetical protein